jgi:hypothetical protein
MAYDTVTSLLSPTVRLVALAERGNDCSILLLLTVNFHHQRD